MLTQEQEKQLADLQALKAAQSGGAGSRFGTAPAPSAGPLPKEIGMLVPIEVATEKGKVTLHMLFDATTAERPKEFVEWLIREGYPVKAWQSNNNNGGGGGGGGRFGGGGGGYQRNRF